MRAAPRVDFPAKLIPGRRMARPSTATTPAWTKMWCGAAMAILAQLRVENLESA